MSTETTPSVETRIGDSLARLMGGDKPEAEEVSEDQGDQAEDQADDESGEPEETQQSNAVDEVEVEFEGWKGKIPQKVKAELDKAADYTRKTQEVADQRRIIDQHQRLQAEQQGFYRETQQEMDQLQQIEVQLQQYSKVDLTQVEGDTLHRMTMAAANLREERARLKELIDGKRGDFKKRVVSSWDEMSKTAEGAVLKAIPDWGKVAAKVAEYAIGEGYPFEVITGYDRATRERVGPGVVDPVFIKTLHKAWKWDQLQSNKPGQMDKAGKAAPVLKPGAADTRGATQVSLMNYKKAVKNAKSDQQKAALIGDRLANRFKF